MPHHNLLPELIFAGSIWLIAIFIFVMMLIAAFASLRSTDKTEAKSRQEPNSNSTLLLQESIRKEGPKIDHNPDIS
jgi:hypothetical protein